jgi:competence protein ComEC
VGLLTLAILIIRKLYTGYILLSIMLIALGFTAGLLRDLSLSTNAIHKQINPIWLTGVVEQIAYANNTARITLSDVRWGQGTRLELIRLSVRTKLPDRLKVGDIISVKAGLLPPPDAVIPGGFSFAEYAYFKGYNAIGYAVSKVRVAGRKTQGKTWQRLINGLRQRIFERIRASVPEPSASFIASLLVGNLAKVPEQYYTTIKSAGIAHILAISGMHMTIVCGTLFLAVRQLIAYCPSLCLRYDGKKIAASVAIAFGFFYLMLAGLPVSAIRAYLMILIIYLAVLIDRQGQAMNAVIWAAILILCTQPEALFAPGLQMSFSATIALIAAYRKAEGGIASSYPKQMRYLLCILYSSLVASLVTTPFVLLHFYNIPSYGVLTNLLIIPLTDFIVIPGAIISLLLMPYQLEGLALWPVAKVTEMIIFLAGKISQLPRAEVHITSLNHNNIAALALLLYLIIIGHNRRLRSLLAVAAILLFVTAIFPDNKPDILIAGDQNLYAIKMHNNYYISSKMKSRYTRNIWQEYLNIGDMSNITELGCDDAYNCLLRLKGRNILFSNQNLPSLPRQFGKKEDILIQLSPFASKHKNAIYTQISSEDFLRHKTHFLYINLDGIAVRTVCDGKNQRSNTCNTNFQIKLGR